MLYTYHMVELHVFTLIFAGPDFPAVLVLQPNETPRPGLARIVPIWIGAPEAMQIGAALEKAKSPRPMTHDLFIDALTNLDAFVDHVLINEVKGDTFYAKLFLRQGGRLVELDARPTDAIALAIREGAPFMIDEDVLEKMSYPYIFKTSPNKDKEMKEFHTFVENLDPDDFK